MNTKIGTIFIAVLLLTVSFVFAEYSVPGTTARDGIECDPVKVAQLAIQDDCDVQGNLDKNTTYSAGINSESARRDCTQRVKPVNKCDWTEEDLKLCEAIVAQYCGQMNQYPSLQERDETGEMVDRDVQSVVEEGGVPSFADATDEEGEAVIPNEDTGTTEPTPTDTQPTTPVEETGSNVWLWWLIIIVIVVAAVWYFMSQKEGNKKPVAKTETKHAKKEEPKKKKR